MTTWDERFREGQYPRDPEPAALLRRAVDAAEPGLALDLAAGTGRNAVFLAEAGYAVEAIDQSRAGLAITMERAAERVVDDRISPVQADIPSHAFPSARYDLVTISFYRPVDRFPDIKEALRPAACSSSSTTSARPSRRPGARAATGTGSPPTSCSTPASTSPSSPTRRGPSGARAATTAAPSRGSSPGTARGHARPIRRFSVVEPAVGPRQPKVGLPVPESPPP